MTVIDATPATEEMLPANDAEERRVAPAPSTNGAAPLSRPGPTALTAATSAAAAAVLGGGLFIGFAATVWGLAAAILGAALVAVSYRSRRPGPIQWLILPAMVVIGAAASSTGGGSASPLQLVEEALRAGGIGQPPIPFDPGWRFLLVMLLGTATAGVAMVAVAFETPKLAVFGPVPLTFCALMLQPSDASSVRTSVALGLVVVSLVLSFGVDLESQGATSAKFQARRIGRGLAMLAVLMGALSLVTQLDFLFPPPEQDQIVPPQKPQTPPPEEDRVIFTVDSEVAGPWRLGTLDVYDGTDWLTPPFDRASLLPVPADGMVPGAVTRQGNTVSATFTLHDLRDRTLPTLSNPTRIEQADAAAMDVDPRTQVIRLTERLPTANQTYTVSAPAAADAATMRTAPEPSSLPSEFVEVPPAPPAVQAILDRAPTDNAYDRLQYVRTEYYKVVVAAGPGEPVSIPPSRVVELLDGEPASPFEITATEVLLARWAGVPARFGYGYYNGDTADGGVREIRPAHGATWLEAYFERVGWVPLLGTPSRAQSSLGSENPNPAVRPSEDLALTVYVPVQRESIYQLYDLARFWVARTLPWVLGLALVIWGYPLGVKAARRFRRERWASRHGPRERIAVAYMEFRDLGLDLNLGAAVTTPLEYLEIVEADDDHVELAWLVTRAIWGDLSRDCRDEDAVVAEELSRSLRARLRGAQPMFNRVLAAVARTSLRAPTSREIPNLWWPKLELRRRTRTRVRRVLARGRLRPVGAVALVLLVLGAGCVEDVPLESSVESALPAELVPEELGPYRFVREPEAEKAYIEAGPRALVEPGFVYTVHEGADVQASVQIAPFKQVLLDDGRHDELRDSVLDSIGAGSMTLKRIGNTPYRIEERPDRTVLVYLPADSSYMVLLVARAGFDDAESLFGGILAYQRGEDPDATVTVISIPDPLRGIDVP